MRNFTLRKRALMVFFLSSFCFILMTIVASRFYIGIVKENYTNERKSNAEFIGFEFSRIITFYAENDPDQLIDSDLLQLYSHLEENTHMCILIDDTVVYGQGFYKHFLDDINLENPNLEIKTYTLENRMEKTLKIIQLTPDIEPLRPDVTPFKRFDIYATLIFILYLILLTTIFMVFINRILKPLEEVKRAANEIKKGNLNYQITYAPNDEIGEVFDAIEDMRNELKHTEKLRNQYEINRNELLSNITHDLKTPITSIKGYIEGIMDGVADTPEKMDKYAKIIYKHASDMDALINDLFLMSKLDIDDIAFHFETLDINAFLTDCYEDYVFDLQSKGIDFYYESNIKDPLYIMGDRQNLMRVLVNIISNSTHYLDKSPATITMTLDAKADHVVITLKDNGKGVPQDQLESIFDRFHRVDDARSSNQGGSGIGLSIVKKIIHKHKGQITAESKLGEWTTMVITLPRVKKPL